MCRCDVHKSSYVQCGQSVFPSQGKHWRGLYFALGDIRTCSLVVKIGHRLVYYLELSFRELGYSITLDILY